MEIIFQKAMETEVKSRAKTETDSPCEAPLWREPGQAVSTEYLKRGVLRYAAEDGDIVGRNAPYFNNRPLYCGPGTEGVVLAGDRPFVRLLAQPYVLGAFCAAVVRGGVGKWLHDASQVESRYRCGRMTWRIEDVALPGTVVTLGAAPMQGVAGFVLRLKAQGLRAGDRLVWAFGGATAGKKDPVGSGYWLTSLRGQWDPVYRGNPNVWKTGDPRKAELALGPEAEWCRGNRVAVEGQTFSLFPPDEVERHAFGRCDRAGRLCASDATAASNPAALPGSASAELPMVCGVIDLQAGVDQVFWTIEAALSTVETAHARRAAPAAAYQAAVADLLNTEQRVQIRTPEPRLDAAVAAVCHAIDGACDRDPFRFWGGAMAWASPFLGWLGIGGATALGWHDRVKDNTAYYLARQVKDDGERTEPRTNKDHLWCLEGPLSRFFGRGRIEPDPHHPYNTQSQFIDQSLRDWRWTADPEIERLLGPALELHLERARVCFDPDDDGLYESYINTMMTDCVWYNGGGSVEESVYIYYGHRAAADMAQRRGDMASAERHNARAAKICEALRTVLWVKDRGHFGLYVEQGGHRRVHSDAWVCSQFLPIDAGLTTPEEAAQALHYTEWGLERIRLPFGGTLCQPSNWVPSKWSVRDMLGGDLFHLALAYFQTGLADEGWEILLGALLENGYASAVPGGFSQIGVGTDCADNTHMFARAVIEGLFGFDPDYPKGLVRIRPAFPTSWPAASVSTPDYSLSYRREGDAEIYRLTLARPAAVEFRLPVSAQAIERVTVNGKDAAWDAQPGFGRTLVVSRAVEGKEFEVVIAMAHRLKPSAAKRINGKAGNTVRLPLPHGAIVRWLDPQRLLEEARAASDGLHGRMVRKAGHFLVLVELRIGDLPRWEVFKVQVSDPVGAAALAAATPRLASERATWRRLDLTPHFNGDVRAIFKQEYLSPRPKTCSVRLGIDGYSSWCMASWRMGLAGNVPPAIDLDNLAGLAGPLGCIRTPQGALFDVQSSVRNIAFTSLWDNWPRSVTVPVKQAGDVAWMLVCGSTFPMQTGIANAEIRLRYADGATERLELTPPFNFWSLCPWGGMDYCYETDAFCLPPEPPPQVQLGHNCRAMVLARRLRPGAELADLTLETLSQDVVIGLMAVSLMSDDKRLTNK